jgi:hypothetical protein
MTAPLTSTPLRRRLEKKFTPERWPEVTVADEHPAS